MPAKRAVTKKLEYEDHVDKLLNVLEEVSNMGKGYSIDLAKKKSVSPVCRGSYVNILEPKAFAEGDTPEYGMQCLFPKSDPEVEAWIKDLKAVFAQVLVDKFGQDKAQKMAAAIKIPLRDGDDPQQTSSMGTPEVLEGHFFMNVKNKFRQPFVIGSMGKPVDAVTLTSDDIYSGAWYRIMMEFWYYDTKGNKGISASVAAIMKVKDDENLGSGTTTSEASDAFEDFASEAASVFEESDKESVEEQSKQEADGFDFM